jgi:hypothetical protein
MFIMPSFGEGVKIILRASHLGPNSNVALEAHPLARMARRNQVDEYGVISLTPTAVQLVDHVREQEQVVDPEQGSARRYDQEGRRLLDGRPTR